MQTGAGDLHKLLQIEVGHSPAAAAAASVWAARVVCRQLIHCPWAASGQGQPCVLQSRQATALLQSQSVRSRGPADGLTRCHVGASPGSQVETSRDGCLKPHHHPGPGGHGVFIKHLNNFFLQPNNSEGFLMR